MENLKYILLLVLIALWINACGNRDMESARRSPAPPAPESVLPTPAHGVGDIAMEPTTEPKAEAPPPLTPKPKPHMAPSKRGARSLAPKNGHATAPKNGHTNSPSVTTEQINSYLVKVEANRKIKMSVDADIPTSGQLDVWIGQPRFEPKNQEGMNAASGVLYTNSIAVSAKVTPSFPDDPSVFKVEPDTSKCMTVEPTGSTARFKITPVRTGQFRIGASVDLYKNAGCNGDAVTKTAEPITVIVSAYVPSAGLLEIAWSAFKNFFKEILAATFALIIIVFRKRLTRLLGIGKKS